MMSGSRRLYGRADMVRLVEPRSVAVVGVSERPNAFGSRVAANMADFDGTLHLVNAKYPTLMGRPCHPSIGDLPEAPDCVVIATAREAVLPVV